MFQITTATTKILKLTKRIKAIQGGTSAGKTISVLSLLIHKAQSDEVATVTSIVSETMPHLRKGAMRDFKAIMQQHKYWKEARWNETNSIYTFETGSIMEFFGADEDSKVKGPRRDRLFINECNNVPYSVFDQLEIRTNDEIFLDWNPTTEFWFYDKVKPRDDVDFVILTYKDNEGLNERIIKSIEQRMGNKAWWDVYGLGLLGEIESRIYSGWAVIDAVPHEARLIGYGLDFGYTNDPTAIVAIYYYNGGYIFDEIAYETGLLNRMIADILKGQKKAIVWADSAEPKSIDEIRGYGVTIMGAEKGPGSVLQGIQFVQSQQCSVTKRSVNIIKEYRNYVWITDKDGNIINEPVGFNDHAMAAIRYGLSAQKADDADSQKEQAERLLSRLKNTTLQTQ